MGTDRCGAERCRRSRRREQKGGGGSGTTRRRARTSHHQNTRSSGEAELQIAMAISPNLSSRGCVGEVAKWKRRGCGGRKRQKRDSEHSVTGRIEKFSGPDKKSQRPKEDRKKRKVEREQTSLLSPSEARFKSRRQLDQGGANGIASQS